MSDECNPFDPKGCKGPWVTSCEKGRFTTFCRKCGRRYGH